MWSDAIATKQRTWWFSVAMGMTLVAALLRVGQRRLRELPAIISSSRLIRQAPVQWDSARTAGLYEDQGVLRKLVISLYKKNSSMCNMGMAWLVGLSNQWISNQACAGCADVFEFFYTLRSICTNRWITHTPSGVQGFSFLLLRGGGGAAAWRTEQCLVVVGGN